MIAIIMMTVKLGIAILSLVVAYFYIKQKHRENKVPPVFAIIPVLAIIIANIISSSLPSLTEEVTLTAIGTGEKGTSGVDEVYLQGYTIDGEEYSAGESLEVVSGKWFWSGETYCWRLETDSRQPDGVTRTVVVRVPVGQDRTLNFQAAQWRGPVEISVADQTWTVDTYSDETYTMNESIGSSSFSLLLQNSLYQLIAFCLVIVIFLGVALHVWKCFLQKPKKINDILTVYGARLACACIAVACFAFMVHYADHDSLWSDELLNVGVLTQNFQGALKFNLIMRDVTPPLYNIIGFFWYRIAPYGQQWLLLLSIIPTAFSIYIIGLVGEKVAGKLCGVFSSAIMGTMLCVWINIAFELRSYSFALFFSCLSLYFYVKMRLGESKKTGIFYSISLTCLAMSHYFAILVFGFFLLSDVYLYLKKKIKFSEIKLYITPTVVIGMWFVLIYINALSMKSTSDIASWYPVPTISSVEDLLYFLAGSYQLIYWVLMLALATALTNLFLKKSEQWDWEKYFISFSLFCIVAMIGLLFTYGNFVNQASTMWEKRYFLVLIPFVCLLCAQFVTILLSKVKTKQLYYGISLGLTVILFFNCVSTVSNHTFKQPFREAADWIYTKTNYIYNEDTLVFVPYVEDTAQGFNHYYLARQGRRELLNVMAQYKVTGEMTTGEDVLQYDCIILANISSNASQSVRDALDQYYDLVEENQDLRVQIYQRK